MSDSEECEWCLEIRAEDLDNDDSYTCEGCDLLFCDNCYQCTGRNLVNEHAEKDNLNSYDSDYYY